MTQPTFIEIDGKRLVWRDIVQRRREQLKAAAKAVQPALFELRDDSRQHITDQIAAAIERGAGEFRLPWHCAGGNIMRPVNVASKKAYRGVNVLALWATAEEKGYSSGIWGTYRQWSEIGAQVRKGEKERLHVGVLS